MLITESHLDPRVYGDDVLEFRPDRLYGNNFDQLNEEYPDAWKPFGNGSRACIGRAFAWQEALLVIAMLFQNFDFELVDPTYELKIKQILTIKPDDLKIKAIPRKSEEMSKRVTTKPSVEVLSPRIPNLRQDLQQGLVTAVRDLTSDKASVRKRHIEIKLPSGTTYKAGDYLLVLPVNLDDTVRRVMRRFQLPWDAHLTTSDIDGLQTFLPARTSISAADLFGSYLELKKTASKRNILAVAAVATDNAVKRRLNRLAMDEDLFHTEVTMKSLSILEILEANPGVELPLASFIRMLVPLQTRIYSIASSPLHSSDRVCLAYSTGGSDNWDTKKHSGVSARYLTSLHEGDSLQIAVRPSQGAFHLPITPIKVPIIMIAAGTGIAPFRGFIQELYHLAQTAPTQGAASALYFGCRNAEEDDLYRSDLDEWELSGVVNVKRAFSRQSETKVGHRYVQHILWSDKMLVKQLWQRGAMVYICGGKAMGEAVKDTLIQILAEIRGTGTAEADIDSAKEYFEGLRNVRWAMECFD